MESSQRNKFHVKNLHRTAMLLWSILTKEIIEMAGPVRYRAGSSLQDGGSSGVVSGLRDSDSEPAPSRMGSRVHSRAAA